jgi:hypothetical protein
VLACIKAIHRHTAVEVTLCKYCHTVNVLALTQHLFKRVEYSAYTVFLGGGIAPFGYNVGYRYLSHVGMAFKKGNKKVGKLS